MDTSVVTVVVSFDLQARDREVWLDAWQAVARAAMRVPTCRSCTLLEDRQRSGHYSLLSVWDSAAAFHRFVRTSGLLWLLRSTKGARYASLTAVPISLSPVGPQPANTPVREEVAAGVR